MSSEIKPHLENLGRLALSNQRERLVATLLFGLALNVLPVPVRPQVDPLAWTALVVGGQAGFASWAVTWKLHEYFFGV